MFRFHNNILSNVGSTSNASNSIAAFRQHIEESHNDFVNLLTQQMTTILNPMIADHETKFDRLARQVERIARIVDYDEGERQNARRANEDFEILFQNENDLRGRENPQLIPRGQNADDVLARLRANQEKVSYVAMESSDEEFDWEAEVDLAELKKGPPYVCSLLKKIPNSKKSNDLKQKSGKRYSFDISKSDHIFDVLLKDKQLVLPEGRTLLSVKDLKGKPYCNFHQATSHSTNNCVCFRDLIQESITEGRLKFDDGKKEMKVNYDPFDSKANFAKPYFGVNMVGMSYDFDVALGSFELDV
ncbi:hypothetical protein Ahy_B03g064188 [Arachis hypogaea]|uniref:Uncharacterized protein n=1 Tax=Arachis hypogaea TaxID=3818 RepID=A0A444ZYW0_ARAHY|nr:hypothetical protein Ahy_B03g064188 [Arachis hypogaea]